VFEWKSTPSDTTEADSGVVHIACAFDAHGGEAIADDITAGRQLLYVSSLAGAARVATRHVSIA
jgi:hypothetical protein